MRKRRSDSVVMRGLDPRIHLIKSIEEDGLPGHRRAEATPFFERLWRAEATPFFERLCPTMTK